MQKPFFAKSVLPVLLAASVLFMAPVDVRAEGGNLSDCLTGCQPGNSLCIDCCIRQFPNQSQTPCDEAFLDCNAQCESLSGLRELMCRKQCQSELRNCLGQSPNPDAEFDCPGWVRPESCPECQTWSYSRQKCVGAPRDFCDPK